MRLEHGVPTAGWVGDWGAGMEEGRMALDGPKLAYARANEEPAIARALQLAREIEELLEDTPSIAPGGDPSKGAHSTRIVRAMAASLADELEALVRGARKSGVA
jgi:hypothetical protein